LALIGALFDSQSEKKRLKSCHLATFRMSSRSTTP
jgi:hypothetical protein